MNSTKSTVFFLSAMLIGVTLTSCASLIAQYMAKPQPMVYNVITHRYKSDSFDLTKEWIESHFLSPQGTITLNDGANGIIQASDAVGIKKIRSPSESLQDYYDRVVAYGTGNSNIPYTIRAQINDNTTVITFTFSSGTDYGMGINDYSPQGEALWGDQYLGSYCDDYIQHYYQYIQPPQGNQRIAALLLFVGR